MIEDSPFRSARRKQAVMVEPSSLSRLPPHSAEAEQGVLASCLLSPRDAIPECISDLKAGPEAFYDLRHRAIYETMVEMNDKTLPIDLITLQQTLKDKNQLESVGGLVYLASIPDAAPSGANLKYYLEIVRDKYTLRSLIGACTEVVAKSYENQGDVELLLDEVEREIHRVTDRADTTTNLHTSKKLVQNTLTVIEHLHKNQGSIDGMPTGFIDLDKMTGGMHPGEMIVIAARPSMGKTALAMNMAEFVACNLSKPVGVFSLEMTAESLMMRMLCSRGRVNLKNVKEGFLSERDFAKLSTSSQQIAKAPLHIDDSSGLSILQLRAKARRMKQQFGIEFLVIDYLQLLHSTNKKAETRQQEVADISNGIKGIAKELKIPVVVLSQLNRELEKDKSRKPRLSDLRESGAIEQDADVAAFLYRPHSDEDGPQDQDAEPINLLIAKQRNGPTGDVYLTFLKTCTRFESAAKISAADLPPVHPD